MIYENSKIMIYTYGTSIKNGQVHHFFFKNHGTLTWVYFFKHFSEFNYAWRKINSNCKYLATLALNGATILKRKIWWISLVHGWVTFPSKMGQHVMEKSENFNMESWPVPLRAHFLPLSPQTKVEFTHFLTAHRAYDNLIH